MVAQPVVTSAGWSVLLLLPEVNMQNKTASTQLKMKEGADLGVGGGASTIQGAGVGMEHPLCA
jgi:hypothetical protein